MEQVRIPSDEPYRAAVLAYLNNIFIKNRTKYWTTVRMIVLYGSAERTGAQGASYGQVSVGVEQGRVESKLLINRWSRYIRTH